MRLQPLGTMAGMPTGGIGSSSYLLYTENTTIMLDAGPGAAVTASRALGGAFALDAVFITHQHTDHILDILAVGKMLLARRLHLDPSRDEVIVDENVPRVPLFVPEGVTPLLDRLAALFPLSTYPVLDKAFELAFDVIEYEPDTQVQVGDAALSFTRLEHAAPDTGVRVESGSKSFAYTGDTGPTDAIVELAHDVDALLIESTLRETDRSGHGHLASSEAASFADAAGAGRLILTHFSSPDPELWQWHRSRAAESFSGVIDVAAPLESFTL